MAGADAPEGDAFSAIAVIVLDDLVVQSQHAECSFAHAIVDQSNRGKLYAANKADQRQEVSKRLHQSGDYSRIRVGKNKGRRKQNKIIGLPLCLLCDRGCL